MLFHPAQAIEAVNLIRLLGHVDMLPTALYQCCQLEPSLILWGVERADGTIERLAPADIELCFQAVRGLHIITQSFLLDIFRPCESCKHFQHCSHVYRNTARVKATEEGGMFSGDPLRYIEDPADVEPLAGSLCQSCAIGRGTARLLYLQEGAWRVLPEIVAVNVPNWGKGLGGSRVRWSL